MAGVFGTWQPRYAEAGIATFPVALIDGRKKPAVSNYLRSGLPASRQWAAKFPDSSALGFGCGKRSGLTVLDVDSTDEKLLARCLDTFGPAKVVIRTASGKFHVYYRWSGEGRQIRSVLPGEPVDLLGAGFAVAPPSEIPTGRYDWLQGSLADLSSLTTLKLPRGAPPTIRKAVVAYKGERNDTIFREAMGRAKQCDNFDALLTYLHRFNAVSMRPPLPDGEVLRVAANAWQKTADGENWFGSGRTVQIPFEQVDRYDGHAGAPDALWLLALLKRIHLGSQRPTFAVANAMHERMNWTVPRFKAARSFLIAAGDLDVVSAQFGKRPAIYRFAKVAALGFEGEQGGTGGGV